MSADQVEQDLRRRLDRIALGIDAHSKLRQGAGLPTLEQLEAEMMLLRLQVELADLEQLAAGVAELAGIRAALEQIGRPPEERVCRICECTDLDPCEGGCCWVEEDLCSQCVGADLEPQEPTLEELEAEEAALLAREIADDEAHAAAADAREAGLPPTEPPADYGEAANLAARTYPELEPTEHELRAAVMTTRELIELPRAEVERRTALLAAAGLDQQGRRIR